MASSAGGMAAAAAPGVGQSPAAGDALPADGARASAAACSWESSADLASVLRLVPEGESGAWDALLGPPQDGESIVVLEGQLGNDNIPPCLLYLHCNAHGSEEIIGVGIVSEARNMEVYIGEEYYGTAKGEKIFAIEHDSKTNQVTFYKKYLKLECSAASCKIKLLSLREKQRVLITKILLQLQSVGTKSSMGSAAVGIDLGKVQTIVESVGSKLSPGAQQLLDMVRCQQKNGFAFGGKLQSIFGRNGYMLGSNHTVDGLKKGVDHRRLDCLLNGTSLLKANLETEMVEEDLNSIRNREAPNTGEISECAGVQTPKPSNIISQNDFRGLVSSFLQEQGNEKPIMPHSTQLLPLLQTVCGQVNRLRLDERNKLSENTSVSEDGIQTVGTEQRSVCMYLEKFLSKQMELIENKLKSYIDVRMQTLQEHVDNKIAAIMDIVQECNNVPQENGDLREGHSTGKR